MSTCIECTHWQPKKGDAKLARMGFAICEKKPIAGHTASAERPACEKFLPLGADKVAARRQWLEKGGRK